MTSSAIAAPLGGAHCSGAWWRCRCPVHGSRGATLALRDGERGLIAVCHAGCSRADIRAELRRLGLLDGVAHDPAAEVEVRSKERDRDTARRIAVARRIWDAARDAHRTPVVAYLSKRGITAPPPPTLRWAPWLKRPDGTSGPAMVAVVEHVDHGIVGVHRTWVMRDASGIWRRRDRASLGPISGGAVRLAPAAELLMIGEGIETCLASMMATAMPAWAALSTSGMVALVLPPIVRTVVILADNDQNGVGERAARTVAQKWLGEGRRVRIAMPSEPGMDWADVLADHGYSRIDEARHEPA